MSKLTIKSGCVEAVFKRGREHTEGTERTQSIKTAQPTPMSETPLQNAEPDTPQELAESPDDEATLI